jgi:hypothetical protein
MQNNLSERSACAFDQWMRTKVRSVHYACNEQMLRAFEKFNCSVTNTVGER